jgi:ketosteroid isomerase-like protein
MSARAHALTALACATWICSAAFAADPQPSIAELTRQVTETEKAFAKTMADRDHAAFTSFLANDAVFFSGPTDVLRGKEQVAKAWRGLYEKPDAPFSWAPEKVEVLDAGNLALSSGPVRNASGEVVGTFTSIWRLEANGKWRIVFDKGCDVCKACAAQ